MEYRVSHFPMPSRFLLTANEKDFSLALEMTVWESGILASLPFSLGKALVRGHDSPSFPWKEMPRSLNEDFTVHDVSYLSLLPMEGGAPKGRRLAHTAE